MRTTENHSPTLADLRRDVIGRDTPVPLLDGTISRYVFLDNAASTPTFYSVIRSMEEFLPWYAGVHRGMGYKAIVATRVYDDAHRIVGSFVNANLSANTVIFTKNTTESINKLARRFSFGPRDTVITTMMEHHSNDLPWRRVAGVRHVPVTREGRLDLAALKSAIGESRGSLKLVAITGASNVTGYCNPIHDIAAWTHQAGAKIFVDAAQLAPHKPIDILDDQDPRHIDFIAFSGHKLYAPFGIGVLIGPRPFFESGDPDIVGGGTVSYVGYDSVDWNDPPDKEEAGSPNVLGAIALAKALTLLQSIGMSNIAWHEEKVLAYALPRILRIPGVTVYGQTSDYSQKVGVIPFTIEGLDHGLVSTILSVEGAVGVRNGNFCAQPYTRTLLGVTQDEERKKRAARCDNPSLPGMVRASIGCYNTEEDIDIFIGMLEKIAHKEYRGRYELDPFTGLYACEGHAIDYSRHFRYDA